MAIDICSEISSFSISPRISFSHDLNQLDQQDPHHYRQNDTVSDFDFCVTKNDNSFTFEFPSADELFSDGKILPAEIKTTCRFPSPVELAKENDISTKKIVQLKELLSLSYDTDEDEERQKNDNDNNNSNNNSDDKKSSGINYMSFWKFRRSNSLNLEKIKSLHFISRSNSTGSTQPTRKPILQKQKSASASSSKAKSRNEYKRSSSFSSFHCRRSSHSAELSSSKSYPRKGNNNSGYNGNNICGSSYYGNNRVTPVLNLPQPYISRVTISLFGFGSLFCNGKVKNKKK